MGCERGLGTSAFTISLAFIPGFIAQPIGAIARPFSALSSSLKGWQTYALPTRAPPSDSPCSMRTGAYNPVRSGGRLVQKGSPMRSTEPPMPTSWFARRASAEDSALSDDAPRVIKPPLVANTCRVDGGPQPRPSGHNHPPPLYEFLHANARQAC